MKMTLRERLWEAGKIAGFLALAVLIAVVTGREHVGILLAIGLLGYALFMIWTHRAQRRRRLPDGRLHHGPDPFLSGPGGARERPRIPSRLDQ